MDRNLKFSLVQPRRAETETEQPIDTVFPQRDDQGSLDKLNQHILLTVQNVNQMQALFTVRGA